MIKSRPFGATLPDTIDGSSVQETNRGNDPPSREIDTEIEAEAGQYGDIFVVNLSTFEWNPAIKGAISTVGICIDGFMDPESYFDEDGTSRGFTVECWFIVKQSGKTYGYKVGGLNATSFWKKQAAHLLSSSAFEEIYSGERPNGVGLTNNTSHPNFTTAGDNISFGWAVHPEAPSSRTKDTDSQSITLWDNLCIQINPADPTTSACNSTSFQDFSGDPANWTGPAEVYLPSSQNPAPGTVTVTCSVSSTTGNLAPSAKIAFTTGSTGGPNGSAYNTRFEFYFHPTKYSPSSLICGLADVQICFDAMARNLAATAGPAGPGPAPGPTFACRQSGKLYIVPAAPFSTIAGVPALASYLNKWTSLSRVLIATDFCEVTETGVNLNSHPFFNSGNGDVELGICLPVVSYNITGEVYLDNLAISPNPDRNQAWQIDLTGYSFSSYLMGNGCGNMNPTMYNCIISACNSLLNSSIIFCGSSLFYFFLSCPAYPGAVGDNNGLNAWYGRLNIFVNGNGVDFALYAPGQSLCQGVKGIDRIGSFFLSTNGASTNSFTPVSMTGTNGGDPNNSNLYCRCNATIGSAATIKRIQ